MMELEENYYLSDKIGEKNLLYLMIGFVVGTVFTLFTVAKIAGWIP